MLDEEVGFRASAFCLLRSEFSCFGFREFKNSHDHRERGYGDVMEEIDLQMLRLTEPRSGGNQSPSRMGARWNAFRPNVRCSFSLIFRECSHPPGQDKQMRNSLVLGWGSKTELARWRSLTRSGGGSMGHFEMRDVARTNGPNFRLAKSAFGLLDWRDLTPIRQGARNWEPDGK